MFSSKLSLRMRKRKKKLINVTIERTRRCVINADAGQSKKQSQKRKKQKAVKRSKKSGFQVKNEELGGSQLKTFWDLRYAVRGFVALRGGRLK